MKMTASDQVNKVASSAGESCRKHTGFRGQFAKPAGFWGGVVGHLMARKNHYMQRVAVDTVDPKPGDRILEIGFGHGRLIELLAARCADTFIAGVDHSEVMVRQAKRRNRNAIRQGRVDPREGDALELPYNEGEFNKVVAVNSFHIWPDADTALREIQRVLKPGGELVLCLRMKHPTRTKFVAPGYTDEGIREVVKLLERVGFRDLEISRYQLAREVVCISARWSN